MGFSLGKGITISARITSRELKRFERGWSGRMQQKSALASVIVRKVAIDLIRDIILLTPVDTGRARAAWTPWMERTGAPVTIGGTAFGKALGRREGRFRENLFPAGDGKLRGASRADHPFVEVTNNVRYIIPLEFGRSPKAPAGMVRITVRRHIRALRGAFRGAA